MDRAALRMQIKTLRQGTPPEVQRDCAQRIADQLCAQDFFKESRSLAFYLPVNGEVDTRFLIEAAQALGKACYLPVLARDEPNHLWFMPFNAQTVFVENRFKIPEPVFEQDRLIAPEALDLVITPLLAFDNKGHRIGMGAGFYDRTFSFLNRNPRPPSPLLCGLGYAFQQVADTEPESWDVSLDYVVTEEAVIVPV